MQMEWSYVGAVVISGLAIVFAALIILIFLVWIMGKIFDKLSAKKSGGNAKKAPAAESSKPAPVNITAAPPPLMTKAKFSPSLPQQWLP